VFDPKIQAPWHRRKNLRNTATATTTTSSSNSRPRPLRIRRHLRRRHRKPRIAVILVYVRRALPVLVQVRRERCVEGVRDEMVEILREEGGFGMLMLIVMLRVVVAMVVQVGFRSKWTVLPACFLWLCVHQQSIQQTHTNPYTNSSNPISSSPSSARPIYTNPTLTPTPT